MTLTKSRPTQIQDQEFSRKRSGKANLRDDIVGGGFSVAFALLLIGFTVTYMWQRNVFESLAIEKVVALVASQEARVEDFVEAGLDDVELLATRDTIIEVLVDADGSLSEQDRATVQGIVNRVADVSHHVEWMRVYDTDLALIATWGDGARDVGDAYLVNAFGGPVVGQVVSSPSGQRVHVVAAPIESEGRVVGLALIGQSTAGLDELTGDYVGLGETGETQLAQPWVDGGARFIAPLRFDADAALRRTADGSQSEAPVVAAIANGASITATSVDYRGEVVVSASRIVDRTGWAVVVKMDRREAMEALSEFLQFGLVILLVGSILAGSFALLVAHQIRKPIREMKDAALAVAAGDRHVVVPNGRVDEIGDLAGAFNAMTSELNLLTGTLEEQVADRTAELQLRNNELRGLIAAKETFLAGISHEVRGPLTAMMGFLDLIGEGSLISDEERPKLLEMAIQQADEVLILIEDLLAAARVESGTLKVASVRVDLEAQVRQVMEGLSSSSSASIEVETLPTFALGDPSRARQIARNLVTNALRYGGEDIHVSTRQHAERALLVVKDNGAGIPPEDRALIFDAYGQARGRRQVDASVGIGLHVSRQLAELMDGQLTYDYVDGCSVFTLDMPVYEAENSDSPA